MVTMEIRNLNTFTKPLFVLLQRVQLAQNLFRRGREMSDRLESCRSENLFRAQGMNYDSLWFLLATSMTRRADPDCKNRPILHSNA